MQCASLMKRKDMHTVDRVETLKQLGAKKLPLKEHLKLFVKAIKKGIR